MDENRQALLADIYARGRAFDAAEPDRLHRKRNLEPDSGAFLHLLVRVLRPPTLLELGTSTGYSTIWLADALLDGLPDALPDGGHRFVTVDNDEARAREAAAHLRQAGLDTRVDQRVADARDVLAASAPGEWSMIFLDAERPAYAGYWPDLDRTLAPGGLLVVDNCSSHAEQVAPLRALVDEAAGYESVLLPVGAGLLLIAKAATAGTPPLG